MTNSKQSKILKSNAIANEIAQDNPAITMLIQRIVAGNFDPRVLFGYHSDPQVFARGDLVLINKDERGRQLSEPYEDIISEVIIHNGELAYQLVEDFPSPMYGSQLTLVRKATAETLAHVEYMEDDDAEDDSDSDDLYASDEVNGLLHDVLKDYFEKSQRDRYTANGSKMMLEHLFAKDADSYAEGFRESELAEEIEEEFDIDIGYEDIKELTFSQLCDFVLAEANGEDGDDDDDESDHVEGWSESEIRAEFNEVIDGVFDKWSLGLLLKGKITLAEAFSQEAHRYVTMSRENEMINRLRYALGTAQIMYHDTENLTYDQIVDYLLNAANAAVKG